MCVCVCCDCIKFTASFNVDVFRTECEIKPRDEEEVCELIAKTLLQIGINGFLTTSAFVYTQWNLISCWRFLSIRLHILVHFDLIFHSIEREISFSRQTYIETWSLGMFQCPNVARSLVKIMDSFVFVTKIDRTSDCLQTIL